MFLYLNAISSFIVPAQLTPVPDPQRRGSLCTQRLALMALITPGSPPPDLTHQSAVNPHNSVLLFKPILKKEKEVPSFLLAQRNPQVTHNVRDREMAPNLIFWFLKSLIGP